MNGSSLLTPSSPSTRDNAGGQRSFKDLLVRAKQEQSADRKAVDDDCGPVISWDSGFVAGDDGIDQPLRVETPPPGFGLQSRLSQSPTF